MKLLQQISWQELFTGWRERESKNSAWISCARDVKGWASWEEWRMFTAQQLGLPDLSWSLYGLEDPLREIPKMLIGPYTGWQGRVIHKNCTTFDELLADPLQLLEWKTHGLVRDMYQSMPFSTDFIGLVRRDTKEIVCIDGHHRAMAITMMHHVFEQKDFSGTSIRIALAEVEDPLLFDRVLARGSEKR